MSLARFYFNILPILSVLGPVRASVPRHSDLEHYFSHWFLDREQKYENLKFFFFNLFTDFIAERLHRPIRTNIFYLYCVLACTTVSIYRHCFFYQTLTIALFTGTSENQES